LGVHFFAAPCIFNYISAKRACFRGSSSGPSGKRSNPNDYVEKQKNTPKPKEPKNNNRKKENNKKNQKPKNKKGQNHQNHAVDLDELETQPQHTIDYEFGETETDMNVMFPDNAMSYHDDPQFYSPGDIYTNAPEFQPPMM